MKVLLGLLISLWFLTAPIQAAQTTEVIELRYTLAESLIPAIEPMLDQNERVSAYGNQIIVRAAPDRIAAIRDAITQLDRRPGRLRISVASADSSHLSQQGYQVDGRIQAGDIEVISRDSRTGNQARIIQRGTRSLDDGVRQITANEGYPVMIQRGSSVPITTTTSNAYGQIVQQTEYRDVSEGFYATVHVNGNMATIYLNSNNDRINRSNDRIVDIQRADTVLTAPLGEWITVAGTGNAQSTQDSGFGRRLSTRNANERSLRLKVERLD